MNAVIYARFSSDGQQEESITAQLRACKEFADRNGHQIIEEYIDRAVSGKNDKRTEFQRMIKDSSTGEFSVVLVHKYDRFARNRYDHAVYGKSLKDNGVELIAVAENFGTGKEAVLMEGLMQALSEYYIVNLSEEVKKGHKEKALQGLHNGGVPPFGYNISNQKYEINELESSYVRRIFDACLNQEGYSDLIEKMNSAGITGKRGKPFRYSSIYEILRNEKYTGVYLYCPMESNNRSKRRSKDGAIRIEDALPVIVDRDKWERVQKIMDSRKNSGKTAKRNYLLSGLVYCECGSPMHAITTKRKGHEYPYYYCSAKCGNKNIKEQEVNAAVFKYLRELLSVDSKDALSAALETYQQDIKIVRAESSGNIKKEIADREKQIQNLMQNMSSSVLPPAVVEDMGKKIQQLTEQIEELSIERMKSGGFSKNDIANYLDAVSDLENQPFELQRKTVQRYIDCIIIKKGSIDITSTFSDLINKMRGRGLGKLGKVPPQPYRVFITDLSIPCGHSISFCLEIGFLCMYGASIRLLCRHLMPALLFYAGIAFGTYSTATPCRVSAV